MEEQGEEEAQNKDANIVLICSKKNLGVKLDQVDEFSLFSPLTNTPQHTV